jgi:hypothetical protein
MMANTMALQSESTVTVLDLTNYWCKTLGIQSKDLGCGVRRTDKGIQIDNQTSHPQIDDVILLIKVLQEYFEELTATKRIHLHILWDWVYKQKKPLTKKHCKQLTRLITQLENHRYHIKKNKQKQRQRIKALKNPAIAR